MRTTLNINDALLAKARIVAAREHTSLTRLIEEGLALRLRPQAQPVLSKRPALPVYPGAGGLNDEISDTLSNRAFYDAADGMDAL